MNEVGSSIQPPPHVDEFLKSPVYIMVLRDTIDTATRSFKVARSLSVVLFFTGFALLAVSVAFGIFRDNATLTALFGGLGTANLVGLLLYRPIERIERGVDGLIRSQLACLSFLAQYNAVMSVNNPDLDHRMRAAQYLKDATTQLFADMDRPVAEAKSRSKLPLTQKGPGA